MKRIRIIIILLMLGLSSFFIANRFLSNPITVNDRTSLKEEIEPSAPLEEPIPIEEEKKTTTTLLAAGDIMFHMPQIRAAYDSNSKTYDFRDVFKYVKKHIDSADLSIANFETVTVGNEMGFSGFPRFNSPEETLKAVKYAGFDILSTANNHALDQGKEGLLNTIRVIEKEGMKNIGTYEGPNNGILIEEINEIKIAFLSYSYGFNGLDYTLSEEELSYMVNRIDENRIRGDIDRAKDLEADVVVVFIHWGNEYQKEPSEYQLELGNKMVEWGANIILGSHPHVVQKSEIINYRGKDNFIIYSMGNFLSNQRKENMDNKYTEDGIMVKIQLEKNFSKGETNIIDITYIPTWVRRYTDNGLKYEILPIGDFLEYKELYSKIDDKEKERIEESYNDTLDKMIKN
ncbi:putative enzyme of poly-gamma-glutamate biosynthesis (Capsule formation) [[Clostridium] ultunense Esp]|uniref:Putative enzyme of poly-gamma-glutamate biosynthesis (Capsule formation) n=1 Tax=[Clostridium] ultunense Esp TaxID=1288971 RepID=M1Z679_9FIRM|nr:CapA family protein [Schnuerera ultunensis]CCQ93546.1 putative enzyme of poly-gamma-glutamate biosynthesis (Capsule formation) [[Clostridium] ultunense Esp]SHD75489.1 putative enzyme of poly-gamma-glutamate biosynthesis (Capsule formation) [[Clostridium] ultunense Esp]